MQIDVVFCDLIRTEVNGKQLLIGVYPGDVIMATHIPGPIHVAAWARVRELPVGKHQFEISFFSPQDSVRTAASFNGTIEVAFAGMISTIHAGPAVIHVDEIGFINVQLKVTTAQGRIIGDQFAGKIFVGKVP
ncbi:hypothetical protein [Neorhizobium tomejilense]|uniref:hypothetical protein n=1 Tax=Neorhizobium tomejilense TaxID=2093828 RepID=UPI003ED0CAEE